MRKFSLLLLLMLVSCIDNNIPYPIVKGNVTAFEVSGQISADIDLGKQTINVTLSDTVNMERVAIKKFSITNDAQCSIDTSGVMNMSKRVEFNITTYQQ